MTRSLVGLFLAFVASACTVSTEEELDTAFSEQASTTSLQVTNVTYTVPVEGHLADAAKFNVRGASFLKLGNDRAQIGYWLPVELTGVPQAIQWDGKFDAAKNAYVFSGGIGTSECTVRGARLRCVEHLPRVDVDVDEAMRHAPETVDRSARQRVIERFPGEPVGILEGDLPRRRSR